MRVEFTPTGAIAIMSEGLGCSMQPAFGDKDHAAEAATQVIRSSE